MKTQFGNLITGDFESNTITFEVDGDLELRAGQYAIVPIVEYEALTKTAKTTNKSDLLGIGDVMGLLPDVTDALNESDARYNDIPDSKERNDTKYGWIESFEWIIREIKLNIKIKGNNP